ncbi:hypothetical protein [Neobacillus niacini]|uniref:hypothetical protein n=1 Tax=Neobacillus niacini TaxID=86668 RepID=UPI00285C328E|nr:hypothetical protein [Neobacillus niacini]MDR6997800.1 hypothetical protein [Neobacillus niacini]
MKLTNLGFGFVYCEWLFADKRSFIADKSMIYADKVRFIADKSMIYADKVRFIADKIKKVGWEFSISMAKH